MADDRIVELIRDGNVGIEHDYVRPLGIAPRVLPPDTASEVVLGS